MYFLATPPVSLEDEVDPRIRIALQLVDASYCRQTRASDVSTKLRLSRSYFERLFRRETGRTFRAYLREVRLRKAITLLSDPTVQVKEIAYLCGYQSAPSFTREFKREFGLSPTDCRRDKFG